ncbi:CBK_G0011460.mRNA.1.CDS.1 [Saccharomyces cerevisiae]|nr:CBK_G0011460.mRNA.1.CDS.1 [Saccharomyces cerevisiae]CAI7215357.1 CBK_G0011460.mRNA.1.CDS.1 [Saccharomyces cerevisiae]
MAKDIEISASEEKTYLRSSSKTEADNRLNDHSFDQFRHLEILHMVKNKRDVNTMSIIDATLKEELLRDGVLTVTLNKNREVVQVSKAGGLPRNDS